MKKINKHKLFIFTIAVITLVILFFFMKNIIVEIIKYQIKNDHDSIKALLSENGWFGYLSIILVEALQMIVVFISAEFIQISAGMSYPWYIAMGLCSAGIFLGATLIYMLCNMTKFDSSIFKKSSDKIKKLKHKNASIQLLMYVLFISPIIPFGAICYFGANSKMSYRRYIFTCVTATIPSIFSSILLGRVITFAITESIPAWIVILAAIGFIAILLSVCFIIVNKILLKENKYTPDSPVYNLLMKMFKIKAKKKIKYSKDKFKDFNVDKPYIILSNHPSGLDVFFICDMVKPDRLTNVLNNYYFRYRVIKWFVRCIGVVPKKLFTPDINTIKGVIKSVKSGYPVFMCPEGRLWLDGTSYYITKETGKFLKQLKIPIVIANIKGAYISKPKWRNKRFKSIVETKVTRIISKEEVMSLTANEINDIINVNISHNEFDYIKEKNLVFKGKNKAVGLENVLYYCPHCHKEFTLSTHNNTIKCDDCGFELSIGDDYHFNSNEYNINNIHDWYELIKNYERKFIENKSVSLSCKVKVKKFNIENKKLDEKGYGECFLTNDCFKFKGNLKEKEFEISIPNLRALAFSCGKEFECYYKNELYYFYPIENSKQCCKWALVADELVKEADLNEEE